MTRISWQTELDCTQTGPRSTLDNAARVLELDPAFNSAHLWFDEFLNQIIFANSPVREWIDEDDLELARYMSRDIGMRSMTDTLANKAVRLVASKRKHHGVREWLDGLTWDGVERIDQALSTLWGATITEDQPQDHVQQASSNFFIGLVARVFVPGCKLDNMVVFEGQQNKGKSLALETLIGSEWYAPAHAKVQDKDFFQDLRGKWLIEISEMDAFHGQALTRVKSVVSTPRDRYRPSYGRASRDFPRQCVFAGTTNKEDWGEDETGLRRFWPILCKGNIDIAAIKSLRGQLFAEALVKYRLGYKWWIMPESTTAVQADRQSRDVWYPIIEQWLIGQTSVEITDVLTNAVKMAVDKQDERAKKRVGRALRLIGWYEKRTMAQYARTCKWYPPDSDVDTEVF